MTEVATERTMEDIVRDELGAPKIVDRSTFQAELDALLFERPTRAAGIARR